MYGIRHFLESLFGIMDLHPFFAWLVQPSISLLTLCRFTNNNEVIINTETRSIDVTKKGVYFAFRDQGACLSLLAVKVYYLKCPEITVGFARYPETATGAMLTSIEKIRGRCVENSVAVQDPHNLCKADGTWSFHTGSCACMAGYEADDAGTACKPCTVGRYKDSVGDAKCEICPAHSQALFAGSVECRCNDNFYRAGGDPKSYGCTRPPSAPRNLHFRFVDFIPVSLLCMYIINISNKMKTRLRDYASRLPVSSRNLASTLY